MLALSRIIAHRGASALAPENTLAAFAKAQQIGAKWVEFDVMLTADDEAVVFHDDTLERTTNGKGTVRNFSYAELQKLDAGAWFSAEFRGEKIPTFKQVLEFLQKNNMAANVEIKPLPGLEKNTAAKVVELIKAYWPKDTALPLISSFAFLALQEVKKLFPNAPLGFLMDEWQDSWDRRASSLECVSIHVNHTLLNRQRAAEIKSTQRYLLAYAVNDPQRITELLSWGVDSIFSDCPAPIFTLL